MAAQIRFRRADDTTSRMPASVSRSNALASARRRGKSDPIDALAVALVDDLEHFRWALVFGEEPPAVLGGFPKHVPFRDGKLLSEPGVTVGCSHRDGHVLGPHRRIRSDHGAEHERRRHVAQSRVPVRAGHVVVRMKQHVVAIIIVIVLEVADESR